MNKHSKPKPRRKSPLRGATPAPVVDPNAPHDRVATIGFPPPAASPNEPQERPSMTSEVADGERDVGSVPHGSGRYESVDR